MNLPNNFELDAQLRWVDTLHVNNQGTRQNLLHDEHPEFGVPGPTRVEIERSIYGKVQWRF